ncbi:hypothetical protein [uncultured Lutibacter sp.]|uniref:hypothetical protein n=1 Tax=uncultured Lutibacter sp. TaxID=437739 RepID=UPI0026369C16|nr:hypothetical protein [uncultured Lutibacter sp.]
MNKLKRGDKHPIKNLIFYQYHHPYYKETNGEVWLSPEEFEKRRDAHAKSTAKYKKENELLYLVSNTIGRGKRKYKDNDIDLKFIEELWIKQEGKCYWFNVDLQIESKKGKNTRNPLKVTIDRLDCTKGYTKKNVVLSCYAANCGRGNASVEEWLLIIKTIQNGLNKTI